MYKREQLENIMTCKWILKNMGISSSVIYINVALSSKMHAKRAFCPTAAPCYGCAAPLI
jgi:hypothetical protein